MYVIQRKASKSFYKLTICSLPHYEGQRGRWRAGWLADNVGTLPLAIWICSIGLYFAWLLKAFNTLCTRKHLIFTCLALHCMLVVQIVIYNNKCSFSSDKNCALRAIWGQILDLLWTENTAAAFLSLCQDRRWELYKSMVWLSWASLISR